MRLFPTFDCQFFPVALLLTFALFYLMQESLAEEMIARFNLNKVSLELTLSSLVCLDRFYGD